MEIINLRHEEIVQNRRTNAYAYINFVDRKRILFSTKAGRAFGLAEGLYMHFINDEDTWMFYVNDNKDGFTLKQRKRNVEIFSQPLIALFTRKTGFSLPAKIPLRLNGAKKDGCQLIELMIKQRFE